MILFYSFFKITFFFKKRGKKDLYKITEVILLENHFKIDVKKLNIDKLYNIIALSNSSIFTVVLVSTSLIDNLVIRLLVMFVLLLPMIYLTYYMVAKYLKKRGF
jgi:hypothetical protein